MVLFRGTQFPREVVLHAVCFYVPCEVSCRDVEAILTERGVSVGHATSKRWVVKFAPRWMVERKDAKLRQRRRGDLMRSTRCAVSGYICIGVWTVTVRPLISCFANTAMRLQLYSSWRRQSI